MFDLILVALSQLSFYLILSILLQYKLLHLLFVRSVMFHSCIRFQVRNQVRNFQAAVAGFWNATSCGKIKNETISIEQQLTTFELLTLCTICC